LLERAKLEGDFLVVGVNTDEWMEQFKCPPVIPWAQRAEIINSLKCVDRIVSSTGTPTYETLRGYGVNKIVVGSSWHDPACGLRKCFENLEKKGIKLIVLEATPGVSTTLIKETLK